MASFDSASFKKSAAALALRFCSQPRERSVGGGAGNALPQQPDQRPVGSGSVAEYIDLGRGSGPSSWQPQPLSTVFIAAEADDKDSDRAHRRPTEPPQPTTSRGSSVLSNFLRVGGCETPPEPVEDPLPRRAPPPMPTPPTSPPPGAAERPAPSDDGGAAAAAMAALQQRLEQWRAVDARAAAAAQHGDGAASNASGARAAVPPTSPFISPPRPSAAGPAPPSHGTHSLELPPPALSSSSCASAGSGAEVTISGRARGCAAMTSPATAGERLQPTGQRDRGAGDAVARFEVASVLGTAGDVREAPHLSHLGAPALAAANSAAVARLDAPMSEASAATANRGSRAPPTADRLDAAAMERLQSLERRLATHQNDHVRQRATLSVAIDRARYELDQSEFRHSELQAQLEGLVRALRERIGSRFATIGQLREDGEAQLQSMVKAQLKALPREHTAAQLDQAKLRQLDGFRVMLEQYTSHVEVQTSLVQQHLRHGVHDAVQQIRGALHVLTHNERDTVKAMHTMIEHFATQTRDQLAELRKDREQFEAHFSMHLQGLRDHARHTTQGAGPAAF